MEDTFSWLRKDHSASKEDYMVSGSPGEKASFRALWPLPLGSLLCLSRLGKASPSGLFLWNMADV